MALLDHLGVSVLDIEQGRRQFHPVLTALGYTLGIEAPNGISWDNGDETEIIIFPIRDEADAAPHRHGEAGWQHLAFSVASREEVDRLHAIAMDAGGQDAARLSGIWDGLLDGGTATIPLAPAPWGGEFGMLVDRFGIAWMVSIDQAQ
jgi:hypothetical protein